MILFAALRSTHLFSARLGWTRFRKRSVPDLRPERAAMARATAYLLSGGGAIGLLSLAFSGTESRGGVLVGASWGALALAAICAVAQDRTPRVFLRLLPSAMTALITVDLLFAANGDTAAVLYFLPVLFALSYFGAAEVVLSILLVSTAQLLVAFVRPDVLTPANALLRLAVIVGVAHVVFRASAQLRDLVGELNRSRHAIRRSHEETIRRLAHAGEFHDEETGEHTKRMSEYCSVLARKLGLPQERAELIRIASPLHDVGKIAIPDRILLKPGPLTAGEIAVMQEHTEVGFEMLTGSGEQTLDIAAQIALTHHERYDGSGYPRRLVGEEIPIAGRVAAVADVFDALTSRRPYRPAMTVEQAVGAIEAGSGSQFDPAVVEAFLGSLGEILEIRREYGGRKTVSLRQSERIDPFALGDRPKVPAPANLRP